MFRGGVCGATGLGKAADRWHGACARQMLIVSYVSRRLAEHNSWRSGRRRRLKGLRVSSDTMHRMETTIFFPTSRRWGYSCVAAAAAAHGWWWGTATQISSRVAGQRRGRRGVTPRTRPPAATCHRKRLAPAERRRRGVRAPIGASRRLCPLRSGGLTSWTFPRLVGRPALGARHPGAVRRATRVAGMFGRRDCSADRAAPGPRPVGWDVR